MPTPKLTEFETKAYYKHILSQTREHRVQYQSKIINITLFIAFIGGLGAWLWWKRKSRLSEEEKIRQQKEIQKYVSEKVGNSYKDETTITQDITPESAHSTTNLITNLPSYENEFELVHPSYKSV